MVSKILGIIFGSLLWASAALAQAGPGPVPAPTPQAPLSQNGANQLVLSYGSGLGLSGSTLVLQPPTASVLGGVKSLTCGANQWLVSLSTGGVLGCAQVSFSNLNGQAVAAQLPAFAGGDCTSSAGTVSLTCTKTNGVAFTTAATTAIGTSGPTIPLNNGNNTNSGNNTYTGANAFNTSPTVPNTSVNDNSSKAVNTASMLSQISSSISASAALRGYLGGLGLSNDGTSPLTVLDIAVGQASSDDATSLMSLGSVYTKTLSSWAAGTGNGMLDTGTIAASTWYHVYLIYNPTTPATDVLLSASATAPTLPSGYTKKRRIGSILTNASSQIVAFTQNGNEFLWNVPVANAAAVANSTTAANVTLTTPLGVKTNALLSVFESASNSNVSYILYVSPLDIPSAAANNTNFTVIGSGNGTSGAPVGAPANIRTNLLSQVRVVSFNSSGSYYINTNGWVDTRGQN